MDGRKSSQSSKVCARIREVKALMCSSIPRFSISAFPPSALRPPFSAFSFQLFSISAFVFALRLPTSDFYSLLSHFSFSASQRLSSSSDFLPPISTLCFLISAFQRLSVCLRPPPSVFRSPLFAFQHLSVSAFSVLSLSVREEFLPTAFLAKTAPRRDKCTTSDLVSS